MPAAPVNFQSWLAAQGLQVQDGILPEDNLSDSLNSAWLESSSNASTQGSSSMNNLQTSTLFVAPPNPQNIINVDVAITVGSLHVSISVEGNELTNVLASDLIPHNIFTEYLSRSILSVVSTYGPWSSGCGLPPLELQVTPPRSFIQVADNDTAHLVCFYVGIYNPEPTSSVQISKIIPHEAIPDMPSMMHTGSSGFTQMTPDS